MGQNTDTAKVFEKRIRALKAKQEKVRKKRDELVSHLGYLYYKQMTEKSPNDEDLSGICESVKEQELRAAALAEEIQSVKNELARHTYMAASIWAGDIHCETDGNQTDTEKSESIS